MNRVPFRARPIVLHKCAPVFSCSACKLNHPNRAQAKKIDRLVLGPFPVGFLLVGAYLRTSIAPIPRYSYMVIYALQPPSSPHLSLVLRFLSSSLKLVLHALDQGGSPADHEAQILFVPLMFLAAASWKILSLAYVHTDIHTYRPL